VPTNKLNFSPYCVSTAAFETDLPIRAEKRGGIREELGIRSDALCILFCGKLSKRKGVDLLLTAVKLLEPGLRDRIVLLYVGEGNLRQELTEQAQSEPPVRIHITGFKNQHELSFYYHAADMAVLPSTYSETWGLVVNEALLHGIPCLVSDRVGSAPDLIQPGVTGEIFSSGDIESLKVKLTQLVGYCRQPDIATSCQQKVSGYSVAHAARGIFELLSAGETQDDLHVQ
jgi:glycosyltransferase involved in cell wall biosynthesis